MHSPQRTHSNRRLAFMFTFLFVLILTLSRKFLSADASESPGTPTQVVSRIDGRWRAVRSSLRLPPLPDTVPVPPPPPPAAPLRIFESRRFDLRKRTSKLKATSPKSVIPQLYFTSDALEEPSLSLKQLSKSFLAVALFEKEMAWEKIRQKEQIQDGQKSTRRLSSWSQSVAKGE